MSLVMCRLTFLIISYQEIGKCHKYKILQACCTFCTWPMY